VKQDTDKPPVEEEGQVEDNKDEGEELPESTNELRVGIFCERGKHRSVAFVEELARRPSLRGSVQVLHRDLEGVSLRKNPKNSRASGGSRSRDCRGHHRQEEEFSSLP